MTPRERYVVLGLAHARAAWFAEVAQWSTSAALPVEFLKCVSVEELRVRVASGRAFSALLVDAGIAGIDRDLADAARLSGAAVLVVDDGRSQRDWIGLGASAILPAQLSRVELLDALGTWATPIARGEATSAGTPAPAASSWHGAAIAVTGVPGAGVSTLAAALAQGLADDPRNAGVVLADLALDADQAMLHDAGDVAPGLPELVDAHRVGVPAIDEVRSLTFDVPGRGYALLLGLRRHRDWATLRPRAVEAALDSLRRAYRVTVLDVDGDVEGEEQCGSSEVEDRNVLARTATSTASVVVVVGLPGARGIHAVVRTVAGLLEHGVEPRRVLVVVNRAPRNPRTRAELTRAVAELVGHLPGGGALASPLFVGERRRLDDALLDGHRLPAQLAGPLATTVAATLEAVGEEPPASPPGSQGPVPVTPGTLPTWSDEDA